VAWNGTGTVVEAGETYALLDAPEHPAPGDGFAGVATDAGGALDGGFPHYDGGGVFGNETGGEVSLLGTAIADATGGRTADWRDVAVTANGEPIRGLSLWLGVERLGVKLVAPGHDFAVGDRIEVGLRAA